jgi:hypothetical protein
METCMGFWEVGASFQGGSDCHDALGFNIEVWAVDQHQVCTTLKDDTMSHAQRVVDDVTQRIVDEVAMDQEDKRRRLDTPTCAPLNPVAGGTGQGCPVVGGSGPLNPFVGGIEPLCPVAGGPGQGQRTLEAIKYLMARGLPEDQATKLGQLPPHQSGGCLQAWERRVLED